MKILGIIPARWNSSRFPGKPLADIQGKPMLQHVIERSMQAVTDLWVATEDQRIFDVVAGLSFQAILTSSSHRTGTDRCAEALTLIEKKTQSSFDVVINIQGDEPFLQAEQLTALTNCFVDDPNCQIATLTKAIHKPDLLHDLNSVKVAVNQQRYALYFSRTVIPAIFPSPNPVTVDSFPFEEHVGLYAFRSETLKQIAQLEPTPLEKAESLEMLRWLENGIPIKVERTSIESFSIDTPGDIERALQWRGTK